MLLAAVQVSVSRESVAQSADGGAAWAAGQTADEIVQGLTAAVANNVRNPPRTGLLLDSRACGVHGSSGEVNDMANGGPLRHSPGGRGTHASAVA